VVGAEEGQEEYFETRMWVEESDPGFALMTVLASVKAAQRRPGWKGLVHFGHAMVEVAAAAVLEGVRNMTETGEAVEGNMVGESATELVEEGEELRSTIAEGFENTVAVVVVVEGADCSGQGLDGYAVGMAVEH
jgi:hypothetical protein